MTRRTGESRHWSRTALRAALLAGIVIVVGIGGACWRSFGCLDVKAYLCSATIVNDEGWTEELSADHPEVLRLLDNELPLVWENCTDRSDPDPLLQRVLEENSADQVGFDVLMVSAPEMVIFDGEGIMGPLDSPYTDDIVASTVNPNWAGVYRA